MFNRSHGLSSVQYFQIAFLDEEPIIRRVALFSKKPSTSLLELQKAKIMLLKKKKIKNTYKPLSYFKKNFFFFNNFFTKLYYYELDDLFNRINNVNFSVKNFFRLLKLKLKQKKSKKKIIFNVVTTRSRLNRRRRVFLYYWYNFYINFFIKNNKINNYIDTDNIKALRVNSVLLTYLNRKLIWNYNQWLGVDIDDPQPQTYFCKNFYFNQMYYYVFKRKVFIKFFYWIDALRKFFLKKKFYKIIIQEKLSNVKIKKLTLISNTSIKFGTLIIFKKTKYLTKYFNVFEKIFFKVQFALKNDNSFYNIFLVKKWYSNRRLKSSYYNNNNNYLINISIKDKLFFKKVNNFYFIEPKAYPFNELFNNSYNIVLEDLVKKVLIFKSFHTLIEILKTDIKKTKHLDISFESSFFAKSHLSIFDFINDFHIKPSINKFNFYQYGYLNVFNKIQITNFIREVIFFKKIKFNNYTVGNGLIKKPINLSKKKSDNLFLYKHKMLSFFNFVNKYKDLTNYQFFNKIFEKYFLFIFLAPIWALIGSIKYKPVDLYLKNFTTQISKVGNLNNSNIFVKNYDNLFGFNMVRFVQKYTPVIRISKVIESHLINYLEEFMQRNVCVYTTVNFNLKYILQYNFIENMYRKLYSMQLFFGKNFFLKEMLEVFLWFFKFKDITLFENWFLKAMHKLQPKKHRKFLLFLKSCICGYFNPFFNASGLKGFFMKISGKISVTGNAKTRSQYIKWGVFGTSKKDNKLELTQNVIRTNTGVLGVTIMISY